MRIVLDTNVLVAAFATHGLCHLVLEAVLAGHEMIVGNTILSEVEEALQSKIKLSKKKQREILGFLRMHGMMGDDSIREGLACRDPEDIKILSLALDSMADFLVTGDQDLLEIEKVGDTPIDTPRQFWEHLKSRGDV